MGKFWDFKITFLWPSIMVLNVITIDNLFQVLFFEPDSPVVSLQSFFLFYVLALYCEKGPKMTIFMRTGK